MAAQLKLVLISRRSNLGTPRTKQLIASGKKKRKLAGELTKLRAALAIESTTVTEQQLGVQSKIRSDLKKRKATV